LLNSKPVVAGNRPAHRFRGLRKLQAPRRARIEHEPWRQQATLRVELLMRVTQLCWRVGLKAKRFHERRLRVV
jgi:hypothetical protein